MLRHSKEVFHAKGREFDMIEILGMCFSESEAGVGFTHDPSLVALSFVVAAIASYTALELGERLRNSSGAQARVWLAGSAIVLGAGIWSMHFIGMLAFASPLERGYDVGLTALSAVVAIVFAAFGFAIVRGGTGAGRLILAGVIFGVGVVAMHYTGMAGLQLIGKLVYRPTLFGLSVVIALSAATVALWLAFTLRSWAQRMGAAFVMAVAICGMHYTGMMGTVIAFDPEQSAATSSALTLSEPVLAASIALGVAGCVLIGLVAAFYERQRELDAVEEAVRLREEVARRTRELEVAAKNLDAALRETERASAAKTDFLSSMSHELRTPMNSILGFAQLLRADGPYEPLQKGQAGAVEQIERAGRHLLALIDEVLDLSQIEAGRMAMSIEAVEIAPLYEEVVALMEPAALEAGVVINIQPMRDPVFVKGDRRRLQQILINFVSNAIKYNRRGGHVELRVVIEDGVARISVRDDGAGIPDQLLKDLFEPFNRLGREQSEIIGAGVGLALCKRLAEAMYGTILVESREGEGSAFTVALPVAPSATLMSSGEQAGEVVLYIEDNPSNVLLMRHVVKGLDNVELAVAATPREGIELAISLQPSLILLDINLPDLDGYDVLRILRNDPVLKDTPVFAVTANALPQEEQRGLDAGFEKYITKPIEVHSLLAAITEALPSQRRLLKRRVKMFSRSKGTKTLELTDRDLAG